MNHNSQSQIRLALSKQSVELKKRWGQNFMVNGRTRKKLVDTLSPVPKDVVWEIGPGLGALTGELLGRCANIVLFEVDYGLIRHLQKELENHPEVSLVPGDFLRTWRKIWQQHGAPNRIIGNLPYSCSSAIIGALLENDAIPASCVFTVQKELAERMVAVPMSRNYSSFSVLCQSFSEILGHGELAPGTFYPVPEVTSAVIELRPPTESIQARDRAVLLQLIRGAFGARRKTLRNNLLANTNFGLDKAELLNAVGAVGVDAGSRAEELSPQMIIRLANELVEKGAVVSNVVDGT